MRRSIRFEQLKPSLPAFNLKVAWDRLRVCSCCGKTGSWCLKCGLRKLPTLCQNSNLIIFEYVQTSYTFWSPKIIFRTCVLHSCYVNRFLVHAAQIEKVANHLQLGICHSNFQNFLQYFDHVLFPRNLQYNSCCETSCCIVHRLRKPANILQEFPISQYVELFQISHAKLSPKIF